MKDRIEKIKAERKLRGLKWADLAKDLPVTGEAVRVAFYRNSVDPLYLERIEQTLGITKRTEGTSVNKSEIELTSPNRIEDIVAKKIIQDLKPFIEKSVEMRQVNQDALNRSSVLLSMLIDKVEELEERLSSIEKTQSKIYDTVSGN